MRKVSAEKAINELVLGQAGFTSEEYRVRLEEIKKLPIEEKMKLAKQENFPKTWHELFEDEETIWYESELPPSIDFVNRIFDSGKGFMTHLGLKHSELIKSYNNGSMRKEHKQRIDQIRSNLSEHPKIIALTKNFKEYAIFDGARRAVAFILEKKNLPVFIGKRSSSSSLPHL